MLINKKIIDAYEQDRKTMDPLNPFYRDLATLGDYEQARKRFNEMFNHNDKAKDLF